MCGLIVDRERCCACGSCLTSCTNKALRLHGPTLTVDENCILCGICVDACPFEALSIKKEEPANIKDFNDYSDIWVFVETKHDVIVPVVYELLGKGRQLADEKGYALAAVLLENSTEKCRDLIEHGCDKIYVVDAPSLSNFFEDIQAQVIGSLIDQYKPDIFLFGATDYGRSLAPRIAARVNTGLTADCTILEIEQKNGLLQQTRPAFGGNLMATIICPNARPQMASVRPGIMTPLLVDESRKGHVILCDCPPLPTESRITLLEHRDAEQSESIADAPVIVSAGNGIRSAKNIPMMKELAELLGGALGATRPLVNLGWCEYKHQIGQTGCTVAPKLMISCGVSGAIQHLAGIGGSETIIAINSDQNAPIFSVAQYKVVGDCTEIVKELIAILKEESA